MTKLNREPTIIESMPELLATAKNMEMEAIAGYAALAEHMAQAGRPELVAVFVRLVAEEREHLSFVESWSQGIGIAEPIGSSSTTNMYDDEDMTITDPELLSAYRAFSVAVRNEERAFLFWTYISAHAATRDIADAAERMAREELGHVAILRHERRAAFHKQRLFAVVKTLSINDLERRIADHLRALMTRAEAPNDFADLAEYALDRGHLMEGRTLEFEHPSSGKNLSITAVAELLLDYYLGEAERSKDEAAANYAQCCAGQVLTTLAAMRDTVTSA